MPKQQTLKFTIRQDGLVTEEVFGAVGNECQDITKSIEERLGNVTYIETKPEYYQSCEAEGIVQEFTHDSEGC